MCWETRTFVRLKHVICEAVVDGNLKIGIRLRARDVGETYCWVWPAHTRPVHVAAVPLVREIDIKVTLIQRIGNTPGGAADRTGVANQGASVFDIHPRLERVLCDLTFCCCWGAPK
jgi:hypothetical protein